jgi:ankyrin repeat protein
MAPHLPRWPLAAHNGYVLHYSGDEEIVRLLIEHGADVNARNTRGHTVLDCDGGHGHLETLQLLLDAGVGSEATQGLMEWLAQYPNNPCYTPISEALQRHLAGA